MFVFVLGLGFRVTRVYDSFLLERNRIDSHFNPLSIQMPLLCCPEDIELNTYKCKHPEYEVCKQCRVPVCSNCERLLWKGRGIPMALGNDNMWGYVTSLIARYKVRWIEMAAILPCWTSMIVYYVEGDHGHVMTESIGKASYRTAVRGHCYSFIMPWEDIMKCLDGMMTDAELACLPRGPECLKYLIRLQLKVDPTVVSIKVRV